MHTVRKIRVRDIEMEVEEAGAGARPFVLVHGFTGSRDDFREHIPALAALGRTLALDQRGHGGTTNSGRAEDYTFDGLVADLAAAFDALGIERADLLGHSLGGMVTMRFALAHPERVASLVLMDTSPRPLPLRFSEKAREAILGAVKSLGMGALVKSMREFGARMPTPPSMVRTRERMGDEAFWARIERKLLAMDPVAWDRLGRAIAEAESMLDRLGGIRCPTLVLVGAEDAPFLAPSDEMERAIPDARRITIPDAAHSPQLENPGPWFEAIRAHLERARAGG